ncbi:MAG: hypothetical protein FJW88_00755 [Actinobacteria bacterium]|nr:hypothetical protein [Actinomycetota bacterium]
MTRLQRPTRHQRQGILCSTTRLLPLLALAVLAAGCSDGQLVDAAGENGGGGAAFVLLAVFFWLFIGSLFYMDKVRKKKAPED